MPPFLGSQPYFCHEHLCLTDEGFLVNNKFFCTLKLSLNKMIEINPIGIIHTPFKELAGMPIQPAGAAGVKGTVEVFKEFQAGLKDLDGFSHIILMYVVHRSK